MDVEIHWAPQGIGNRLQAKTLSQSQRVYGESIKLARQSRGLSRMDLAEQLDLHWAYVVDWERDCLRPADEHLAELTIILKYPVEFFAIRHEPIGMIGNSAIYHGEWSDCEVDAL